MKHRYTKNFNFFAFFGLILVAATKSTCAFELTGSKWLGAETDFYVSIEGASGTGILWNTAFITALEEWTTETPFTFTWREEYRDPCENDGVNGVDFVGNYCGSEFGENVLGITVTRYENTILGEPNLVQADIILNGSEKFDIFGGALPPVGPLSDRFDFRRAALHELGHVIGLEHENTIPGIMAPDISDIDRLQPDDIAGVKALYGGLDNCEIKDLDFGITHAALDSSDCRVQELTVGGDDTSYIDIYRFELHGTTKLEFTMSSSVLESVLILATSKLEFLAVDSDTYGDCNSTLTSTLEAGNYLLLANTYDQAVKDSCTLIGPYQLKTVFLSPQVLGSNSSLLGGSSSAEFRGGITADDGASYENRFKPGDSLDMTAEIAMDPAHIGQAGFLVVGAFLDGQVLLLNEQGEFEYADPIPDPITRAVSKVLGTDESITVFTDLVPAALGIESLVVDFFFGYGLDSNPEEIYFHQVPLNLVISP